MDNFWGILYLNYLKYIYLKFYSNFYLFFILNNGK